jgi:FlgD Ig-like domain
MRIYQGGKGLKKCLSLGLVAVVTLLSTQVAWAASINAQDPSTPALRDAETISGPAFRFSNSGSGLAKALTDTFVLYGGPGSLEGKFQTVLGGSGGAADLQGWIGVDRTQQPTFWHGDTFNASAFTGAVGNRAMWCGVPAATPGFATPPGYGNNWDDRLVFNTAVNPVSAHDVRLQFEYNYESEGGYDFFIVEYDSAGVTQTLLSVSGSSADTNGVFVPLLFDQSWSMPNTAFGGQGGDQITIRLRFTSDGAWSDEDGLNPTSVGAVQADNLKVWIDGGLVSTADFDGAAGDADWVNEAAPFVGDFAKVFQSFNDIDPCRSNVTPVAGFVDNGTPPSNAPGETTGGMISANWSYGVPGGWVTNFDGGLTFSSDFALNNDLWSPEILWDDPSTTADDALTGGAFLRFDAWTHLPRLNGMRWVYYVRSFPDPNGEWTSWNNRGFVYFSANSSWSANQIDVSDMLVQSPQKVQVSVATRDMAEIFGYPGGDSTPAPVYDNVTFAKYQAGGPAHSQRTIDPLMDSFPNSGAIDVGGGLANLSIRIDMTNEINTGAAAIAGDSTVVDVVPVIPGTALAAFPSMNWVLDANPLFDSVRVLPVGATLAGTFIGRDGRSWNRWTGAVLGQESRNIAGAVIADRYFFDLPDGPANPAAPHQVDENPMFFPGDLIRYHFATTDTGGNTSTLPASISGFLDGNGYSRAFTIRGLPSLLDPDGDGVPIQPEILVLNDGGRRGEENDFLSAFAQNGYVEGVDFDTYTANAPSSSVTDGIGSAGVHGANADQLSGYNTMFYFIGNSTNGLSNGVLAGDKGDDIGVLTQWHGLAGDRYFAYFGDNFASRLQSIGGTGLTYLSTLLGVDVQDNDVRDDIAGQVAAIVVPTAAGGGLFAQSYVAYGGCLGINTFDNISALPGAVAAHEFLSSAGVSGTFPSAASVWNARTENVAGTIYNRVDATFPYGFRYIRSSVSKAAGNVSATTKLMEELLVAFSHPINSGGATPAPVPGLRTALYDNVPNPFNPSTTIAFRIGERGDYTLSVYNLRGELVRTLLEGELEAGEQQVVWNGRDRSGASVSSGVYLYSLKGANSQETRKMALMK